MLDHQGSNVTMLQEQQLVADRKTTLVTTLLSWDKVPGYADAARRLVWQCGVEHCGSFTAAIQELQ